MSVEQAYTVESGSFGALLVPNASANTKGVYKELIASTTVAAKGLVIVTDPFTAVDFLFDIATGAAGAETVIIANLLCKGDTGSGNAQCLFIPMVIAVGTRIAGRCQANGASAAGMRIGVWLNSVADAGFELVTSTTNYGANTADSGGTSVDPGGTGGTKGSYVQLSASTTSDIDFIYLLLGNQSNTVRTQCGWVLDIATGAAASEVVVVPNIVVRGSSVVDWVTPILVGPFAVTIASGTRLAVRAACDIIDATDRLLDVALLGLTGTAAGGGASFNASIR